MRRFIIILLLLLPFFDSHAGEHIVLYRFGEKDPAAWSMLRKYFNSKGYSIITYEGTNDLERHVENVNKINRGKGTLLLAIDFSIRESHNVLIAVTNAQGGKGNILAIDEVPAVHAGKSKEFAMLVASSFNKNVKELPLFPLLGIDMPGIFLRIECTKEKVNETFDKLHASMQKYFKKDTPHAQER